MKALISLTLAILASLLCQSTSAQGASEGAQSTTKGPAAASRRVSPSTEFRLIIHPDSPSDEITKSRLSQILLKKTPTWPEGHRAFPVDLEGNSSVREALSREIHGRSSASIKSFWQRQIFSGRSVPPPELATDQAVMQYVRRQPGAVGYVSPNVPLDGVRELFLIEEE